MFTDDIFTRIINSENILLGGTFIYRKGYVQTIIIMYYDTLYYKMIPGIIIIVNNKTLNGYLEIINYIKYSILSKIENKLEKLK